MAELELVETGPKACCSPEAQEACCEPEAKTDCCGADHGDRCGCSAGASSADEAQELVRDR